MQEIAKRVVYVVDGSVGGAYEFVLPLFSSTLGEVRRGCCGSRQVSFDVAYGALATGRFLCCTWHDASASVRKGPPRLQEEHAALDALLAECRECSSAGPVDGCCLIDLLFLGSRAGPAEQEPVVLSADDHARIFGLLGLASSFASVRIFCDEGWQQDDFFAAVSSHCPVRPLATHDIETCVEELSLDLRLVGLQEAPSRPTDWYVLKVVPELLRTGAPVSSKPVGPPSLHGIPSQLLAKQPSLDSLSNFPLHLRSGVLFELSPVDSIGSSPGDGATICCDPATGRLFLVYEAEDTLLLEAVYSGQAMHQASLAAFQFVSRFDIHGFWAAGSRPEMGMLETQLPGSVTEPAMPDWQRAFSWVHSYRMLPRDCPSTVSPSCAALEDPNIGLHLGTAARVHADFDRAQRCGRIGRHAGSWRPSRETQLQDGSIRQKTVTSTTSAAEEEIEGDEEEEKLPELQGKGKAPRSGDPARAGSRGLQPERRSLGGRGQQPGGPTDPGNRMDRAALSVDGNGDEDANGSSSSRGLMGLARHSLKSFLRLRLQMLLNSSGRKKETEYFQVFYKVCWAVLEKEVADSSNAAPLDSLLIAGVVDRVTASMKGVLIQPADQSHQLMASDAMSPATPSNAMGAPVSSPMPGFHFISRQHPTACDATQRQREQQRQPSFVSPAARVTPIPSEKRR